MAFYAQTGSDGLPYPDHHAGRYLLLAGYLASFARALSSIL
jgi:hypothetical protein